MTSQILEIEPRVRIVGALLGDSPGRRRGRSSDVVGSRPYAPGDDVRLIDWAATARVSAVAGDVRFVVRETYAEESPVLVLAVDRAPTMALYPPSLPWLHKPAALSRCLRLLSDAAAARRCPVAYVDSRSELTAPRAAATRRLEALPPDDHAADADWLWTRLVDGRRWLPPGSMVFLFSDFLRPLGHRLLVEAAEAEWELVPVVVSDPVWERSFPEEVGRMTLPVADGAGRLRPVRLSATEARARRGQNELRHAELVRRFSEAGWPPIVLGGSDDAAIESSFLEWAAEREDWR